MCNTVLMNQRLGETNINCVGATMTVVGYTDACHILVKFTDVEEVVATNYANFKKGTVRSRFSPSVYGIGYLGNLSTMGNDGKTSLSYRTWVHMIERCTSTAYQEKKPTYRGCSVSQDWLNYSNFKVWYDANIYTVDNEVINLDKDIILKGNKVYSAETCVLTPCRINNLFITHSKTVTSLPQGVTPARNGKYIASCNRGPSVQYLGTYDTIDEAQKVYIENKESYVKTVAHQYYGRIPQKLYDSLMSYSVA